MKEYLPRLMPSVVRAATEGVDSVNVAELSTSLGVLQKQVKKVLLDLGWKISMTKNENGERERRYYRPGKHWMEITLARLGGGALVPPGEGTAGHDPDLSPAEPHE